MDWLTQWHVGIYGTLNPSRARRLAINSLLGTTFLAVYGGWTDFVPSALVADGGLYLAAAVGLSVGLFVSHGYATGRFAWQGNPGLLARLLCYAALLVAFYCVAWLVIVRAVPDVITYIFGTHNSRIMVLEASHDGSRRTCDYQLQGPELTFPGHICISGPEFYGFPPRGEVILRGKSTFLGMHVSHVEPGGK